jgi:hypothetical protein
VAIGSGARGFRLDFDERELDALLHGYDGPVARMLARKGELVAQGMKRRAPVSPDGSHGRPSGYMRSKVGWQMGRDVISLYVDIGTSARTPDGKPYPLFVEFGTRAHIIRPKRRDGMLRFRGRDGWVWASVVHHPGTSAQPFIRPALDDLRGA